MGYRGRGFEFKGEGFGEGSYSRLVDFCVTQLYDFFRLIDVVRLCGGFGLRLGGYGLQGYLAHKKHPAP